MLNKTILVFYVNVGNLDPEDASQFLNKLQLKIKPKEEDKNEVIQYVIPIREGETRVECINAPILITSEEQKNEVMLKMHKLDKKLDRITAYMNAENEMRQVIVEKF